MAQESFFAGLDLGQSADFSALAVLARKPAEYPTTKRRWQYKLRWMETWDLGTEYPVICSGVATRFGHRDTGTPAAKNLDETTTPLSYVPLAVDYTGVGTAVVHILRATRIKARLHPVLITAGAKTELMNAEAGREAHHVPKRELVGSLIALLQGDFLEWPDPTRMPERTPDQKAARRAISRFEREVMAFRRKRTEAKNVTFGAEQSQHDDLVLAVMLAAWLGENTGGGDIAGISLPEPGAGSVLEAAPGGVFDTDPAYHRGSGFDDRR